jgi:IclR family acetate operon transcriptional repressor
MLHDVERSSSVQSVDRTLQLFELVLRAPRELGLRDLAETSGLPVGTAHRLLTVLVARGYLRQDEQSRRYRVGPTALELASRVSASDGLLALAQPVLRELVQATGESANLAVLDGDRAVYVAQEQGPRMVRVFTQVGNRVPLHATGAGKVLLAWQSSGAREATVQRLNLEPSTRATITDAARLAEELERIRHRGFALDDEELEEGVRCVAAPVLDRSGSVRASLSVSGPAARMTRERADELSGTLVSAARTLGARLG